MYKYKDILLVLIYCGLLLQSWDSVIVLCFAVRYFMSILVFAALLSLSLPSWCLVIVGWLCLAVPWVCLQFVIVVFPDHTHLLFYKKFVLEEL